MTEEERWLIQGLADRIRNAPAPVIDRDADTLIRQSIGSRPDALYILTQTVLIQEMALDQANRQLEQLKSQQPPANFLPNRPSPAPPTPPVPPPPPGNYQNSRYSGSYQPPPPQPPPLPTQYVVVEQQVSGSRFSDFLHNAAQTAAGVIAGEVAFSALSSIFGHPGGGFFGGGGYYSPGSETIVNNYYEDGPHFGGGFGGDAGPGPYPGDTRVADTGFDNTAGAEDIDGTSADDTSSDSSDDSSSYDDGSGSDDQ